ncbi:hypothetical protein ACHAWT_003838 [Skeletonema menzelii]|mmetsp:Transcript_19889/g.32600  ORF Transcript_19889/g.32600 Transcript_19889/m.32600 type:complete len:341 (+) Transcript_19889:77-1099(+)|eukprot:scaffold27072_cov219-Skeletonema_menzelii.AAC.5
MNLSFLAWLKFQPLHGLYGSVGNHACKAISQTSALTPGDEKQQTVSNWAFQYIEQATSRLASHLTVVSSSLREGCRASGYNWLLAPMITRMQDASMSMHSINIKPSLTIAECEHIKESRSPSRVPARASPLEQQQRVLQQQDYNNYQFPPPLRRVNSKEWARQYKGERIDKINFNNVFGPLDATNNEIPVLPDPNHCAPEKIESSSTLSDLLHSSSSSSTGGSSVASDDGLTLSPSTVKSSAMASGPSPADVICGRGGKANTHPGNISFREEAKKLRNWYESSSKSEKFTISAMLVDLVRERGGRFLKRDDKQAGNWLEADANDVRKKASQALREGRKHQ